MSEWAAKYPVKITATEDTIQDGFEKLRQEVPVIYRLLNRLRRLDAGAGQDVSDAEAYSLRVDTTLNHLLIRDGKNEKWIDLGEIADNFGITADSIGAVKLNGDSGGFYFGTASTRPDPANPDDEERVEALKTDDLFLSMNEKRIYRWTGVAWEVWLSLNYGDMLNYEKYTLSVDQIAYSGKDKILRLDKSTGKGNIDIAGSPERLFDKQIDVEDLHDGDVLVYNAEKDKIVNLPNGEKIGGQIAVALRDLKDGQTLMYDAGTRTFLPVHLQTVTHTATIAVADWEKLPEASGPYLYYHDISTDDVTADTFVQLAVDDAGQDIALAAGLSPKCLTRNGYIRLHAVAVPTADLSVMYAVQPSRVSP